MGWFEETGWTYEMTMPDLATAKLFVKRDRKARPLLYEGKEIRFRETRRGQVEIQSRLKRG